MDKMYTDLIISIFYGKKLHGIFMKIHVSKEFVF